MENGTRSKLIIGLVLGLFFAFALWLRVYLPYDKIFASSGIKFAGVDAYYYMELVDNMAHNFPHQTTFLPYMIYPGGEGAGNVHFFGSLLATIIWIGSLGKPTAHFIDVIAVWYPAILGALTVIPVYFIGKELRGRWTGIIAAGLIALLPGEFLGRSILGSTDHHVAESLFTAVTMLFLILALKSARERQLTIDHFKRLDWGTFLKPIVYSLLGGVFLGIYLLTFIGGLLFVFIIFVYFVIQFIIDHLKRQSIGYLSAVGVAFFAMATVIFWPVIHDRFTLIPLVIALVVLPALSLMSWYMASRKMKPAYFPMAMVVIGIVGLGIFRLAAPSLLNSMMAAFGIFKPTGTALTTLEMQPLLFPGGTFSFQIVWGNFTTSFFVFLAGLVMLIYLTIKRGEPEKGLLVVWSLIILAAALGQRRFSYYFAVNVAVLTGYVTGGILDRIGLTKPVISPQAVRRREVRGGRPRPQRRGPSATLVYVNLGLALLIIMLAVYFPNIQPAVATASSAQFAPTDAWMEALAWLRDKTPEPLDNPAKYYQLETSHQYASLSGLKASIPSPSGDPSFYAKLPASYPYPESAYGVLSWWDYGYWITRIAHRIPNANPSQDPRPVKQVATFFTSQNETRSNEIAQELGTGYVVIDSETALGKFWAVALWAGKQQSDFFDIYYLPQDNQLRATQLFYPEYYRSTLVRLYNFDGKAVTPQQINVISYEDRKSNDGKPFKLITSAKQFNTTEEAQAYISSQQSGNYRIVGIDPFSSPVPLEAVTEYKRVFGSTDILNISQANQVPQLKIFLFTGGKLGKGS